MKKHILTFIKNLQFIFMPHYWIMNYPYSAHWDAKLNKLLDTFEFTNVCKHTAYLGDTAIWINNYPYASFQDYHKMHICRASRLTILKAENLLKRKEPIDAYFINQLD